LATGLRFANDLEIGFTLQQLSKPLANDRVVISQQYSDVFHKHYLRCWANVNLVLQQRQWGKHRNVET